MHFYAFKYNKDKQQIELGDTGKVVARRDSSNSRMFVPDVDPSIGSKVAVHVLSGLYRRHSIRFGEGEMAAESLSKGEFPLSETLNPESLKENSLEYNEYTDTVRVKETNQMVMKRKGDDWVFDFDSGAPEALVQQAFLRFHQNPELRRADSRQLMDALNGRPEQKLEGQELGM